MFDEETSRGVRLPSQLTNPRAQIDKVVGTHAQHTPHPAEVFGIATHMSTDKSGCWVPLHEVQQPAHDAYERRIGWAGKVPIRVFFEFFPALIAFIQWIEECHRICDMDRYREAKLCSSLPDQS